MIFVGEFMHLNEYIRLERGNKFAAASLKKDETYRAYVDALKHRRNAIKEYPVSIHFAWYTKDAKVDPDNVAFAKKYILDGMVEAKVIEKDSRKFINGFSDDFFVDAKSPRVEVSILPYPHNESLQSN